jgi:hypothetical protein
MTAPRNPYFILAAALLVPGSGHALLKLAQRGLMFLFFMIILGWASRNTMPEHFTFFGKHVGGIFVYGMSVLDAYRIARIRLVEWTHAKNSDPRL